MAIRILHMNGDDEPLGQNWAAGFLRRNLRVHSIIGRKIDASRATAANPESIREFLELYEATRRRLDIQLRDTYNIDETGIVLGVCNNSRVIASASKHKAYVKSPENREWVTIIECVSADGCTLRPVVIFKGNHVLTSWFQSQSLPNWLFTTSQNGWTSNSIGLEWSRSVFPPETSSSPPRNRLLIVDGHGSHVDIEFMWSCYNNNVHLLYLPAHASHLLQPLDLPPFSAINVGGKRPEMKAPTRFTYMPNYRES
jgi:hypothetical protein